MNLADDAEVFYLAYGSNMNPDVFEKRRGIKPTQVCIAQWHHILALCMQSAWLQVEFFLRGYTLF